MEMEAYFSFGSRDEVQYLQIVNYGELDLHENNVIKMLKKHKA